MAEKKKKGQKVPAEPLEETNAQPNEPPEAEAPTETEALTAQLAELSDKLLRTRAEFDNFRKRSQREKEGRYSDAKADTIALFLPTLDDFERALSTQSSDEVFRQGVEMIYKNLLLTIEKLGVEEINPKDEAFSPDFHNAVMHVDDENAGASTVVEVFQKGYRMGEKVLRYAMVKVAN